MTQKKNIQHGIRLYVAKTVSTEQLQQHIPYKHSKYHA